MKTLRVLVIIMTIYGMDVINVIAEDMSKPLLVIRELDPRSFESSDQPRFALYDNQEVIFFNPLCSWQSSFLHVTLSDYEFQNLLAYIDISDNLFTLNTFYNVSPWSENIIQEFYVHLNNKPPKKIVVDGHLREPRLPKDIEAVTEDIYHQLRTSCGSQQSIRYVLRKTLAEEQYQQTAPPKTVEVCGVELEFYKAVVAARYMPEIETYHTIRDQCPHELIFLFDTLADYCHPRAEAWLPENIEVMIRPADKSAMTSVTDWPPEWSDLHDPATRKREGDGYSLFLDSDEWEAFQDFLIKLRRGTVRINGRTWWMSYRFPFPHEDAWKKNGWRHEQ